MRRVAGRLQGVHIPWLGRWADRFWSKLVVGLALGFLAAGISIVYGDSGDRAGTIAILIAGLLLASWFGGVVAGLVVSLAGLVVTFYYFSGVRNDFAMSEDHIGPLAAYATTATITNAFNIWRRLVEQDLLRTREQLRSALATKDEFLGVVSHELGNALTIVRGDAAVLSRYPEMPDSSKQEILSDLIGGVDRLQRIVANILGLARLGLGQTPELVPIPLCKVAEAAVEHFRRGAPDRKVCLQIPEVEILVQGNASYLEQVFSNLLSNAHKYSATSELIEVSLNAADGDAVARVMDRGGGIPADLNEVLYAPFSRAEDVANLVPGLGLGLTTCKRLVEAQNGKIRAEPREGGGTTFVVTLPALARQDVSRGAGGQEPAGQAESAGRL